MKNNKIIILIIFLLIASLTISCSNKNYVLINEYKINVELAENQQQQQKGLMNRTELCLNCGMLFIFPEEKMQSFWMKNTLIPLDMIFINRHNVIIDIQEAEPCNEEPCTTYKSPFPAKYVLELNKGYCKKNNITINDKIEIHIN